VQDIATLFEAFDSEGLGTLDCDVLSHVLTSVASDLVGDEEAICALLHRASCARQRAAVQLTAKHVHPAFAGWAIARGRGSQRASQPVQTDEPFCEFDPF